MTSKTMAALGLSNRKRVLDQFPGTAREIAAQTGIHRETVDSIINRMLKLGTAAIVGYKSRELMTRGGLPVRIYGHSEDVPMPGKPMCAVPKSQFRTIWIDGAHPCSIVNPWARMAA